MATGTADNSNIVLAKPLSVVGGVFVAPKGTTLPTDAKATLDSAFKTVGYITSDAVTRTIDRSVDNIYAWGGYLVATAVSESSMQVSFSCMEYLNATAQKLLYGEANVTETAATTEHGTQLSIQIDPGAVADHCVLVIDVKGETSVGRIIYPDFQVTEVDDVQLMENEATTVPVTGVAFSDSNGKASYEYWEKNDVASGD